MVKVDEKILPIVTATPGVMNQKGILVELMHFWEVGVR